jgi:hypothetical protein
MSATIGRWQAEKKATISRDFPELFRSFGQRCSAENPDFQVSKEVLVLVP